MPRPSKFDNVSLTREQFKVLASDIMSLGKKTRHAAAINGETATLVGARLVLVDGQTIAEAAKQTGVSDSAINITATRLLRMKQNIDRFNSFAAA